jgi:midasin
MKAQQSQAMGLDNMKPSKMNRLQRSLVSGRVSAVAKDSTVRISQFLSYTLGIFKTYLEQNVDVRQHWKANPPPLLESST